MRLMCYTEKGHIEKSARSALSPLCLALLGFAKLVPMPASIPLSPASPKGRAGIGQAMPRCWVLPSPCTYPEPALCHALRGERSRSTMRPEGLGQEDVGSQLLPAAGVYQPHFTPPARSAQAAPVAPALAGEAGASSPASPSHPAVPERDKPATRTVPCFFHRFCVSISMELMNNSNMNIIHSIWARVISGREEIKSSKRLVGSSPARASRGAVGGRRTALGLTPSHPGAATRTQLRFQVA